MRLPFIRHPLLRHWATEPPPWNGGAGGPELAALLDSRERRVARLGAALAPAGIDLAGDPLSTVFALDRWTRDTWPGMIRRGWVALGIDPLADWPRATGEQAAAHTLAIDVAVALGELALRGAPLFAWGVNRFHDHGATGDSLFGRAVLLEPSLPPAAPHPPVCSPIDLVLMRFDATGGSGFDDPPFVEGLRPVWWRTHRHLYVGPGQIADPG